jgi:hypothetical protein
MTDGFAGFDLQRAYALAGAVIVGLTTCLSRATLGHAINIPSGYRQGEVVADLSLRSTGMHAEAFSMGGVATGGSSYILLIFGPDPNDPGQLGVISERRYDCGPAVAPLLWYMDVTPTDRPSQLRLNFPVNPAGGQYQFHFITYAHGFAAAALGGGGGARASAYLNGFRVLITA